MLFYSRRATISAQAGDNPPCYCEPAGVSAPIFSRGALRLELFPLAVGGSGEWFEGFGLHIDTSLGFPKTNLGGTNVTSSTSGALAFGAQYRLVLWDSLTATDVQLRFGYSLYAFPLTGSPFPGLAFRSPYAGLKFTVPLGSESFALVAGADYLFRVIGYGGAEKLGLQVQAGSALRAEGGLRLVLAEVLEVTGTFYLEQYSVSFDGQSHLANTNLQYQNPSVTDRIMGGMITAGFAL
jgi:hypothetical protein